eukprot:TRINITY_DN31313_c0_g1_i1.p1 TRINITY_DN31313_c0_g1~~TRINITY_DN31313_c0_g1_i1.p1  ORF type:complete len:232 (-),score=36.49 TRINITY_DN31313_c0_g1_i1:146-739(-)
MAQRQSNVELFHDLNRWLASQLDEIETVRKRHARLNTRSKEAIDKIAHQLQCDSSDRRREVNEFSLEMEQYTLRKFDLLTDDIAAAHREQQFAESTSAADDYIRKQRQISDLCIGVDVMHDSLLKVSKAWTSFVAGHCGPGAIDRPHAVSYAAAENLPNVAALIRDPRVADLDEAQRAEDLRFQEVAKGIVPGPAQA